MNGFTVKDTETARETAIEKILSIRNRNLCSADRCKSAIENMEEHTSFEEDVEKRT